jgi:hypothetical protein
MNHSPKLALKIPSHHSHNSSSVLLRKQRLHWQWIGSSISWSGAGQKEGVWIVCG